MDPAVICLVHDGHDRAVLARQVAWLPRLFHHRRFRRGRGVIRVLCGARGRRGDRADRHRRAVSREPARPFLRSLMVGFMPQRSRAGVRVQRRRDRRGGVVHPRRGPREALDAGDWDQRLAIAAVAARHDFYRPRRSSSPGPFLGFRAPGDYSAHRDHSAPWDQSIGTRDQSGRRSGGFAEPINTGCARLRATTNRRGKCCPPAKDARSDRPPMSGVWLAKRDVAAWPVVRPP